MATYIKRKNGYLCQIRRKGHDSISRTFNTKVEAERWALSVESRMGSGEYIDTKEILNTTLAECLDRYLSEITPSKKSQRAERYRISVLLKSELAKKTIGTIKSSDIAKWRDIRLSTVKSGTARLDMSLLSHVFTIAAKEWGMPLLNPVANVRMPKPGNSRERVMTMAEQNAMLAIASPLMKSIIIVALETAMRRGEIVSLRWEWIKGRVAILPDTKNGTQRKVPLSQRAFDAIHSMTRNIDGKIFDITAQLCTGMFVKYCDELNIEDLNFHDLRHTATTDLFGKGLSVMEVQSITGHRDLKMLLRYTHINADSLASKLG